MHGLGWKIACEAMNFIIIALHPEDEQMHISTTVFFIQFSALEMTSKIYFAKVSLYVIIWKQ